MPAEPFSESLRLASPFASHMVLQRDRPLEIWGWDRPGQSLGVTLEGETFLHAATLAASDGSWSVRLPALPASGPYSLRVDGSRSVVLDDVWLGEVWIASGQSNMEWSVARADDAEATIERADDGVRYLRVERIAKRRPAREVEAEWRVVSPDTVGDMTAVGYAFAVELRRCLGVQVGIIDASWGGTLVEAWTRREALARVMDVDAALSALEVDEEHVEAIRAKYQAAFAAWEAKYLPPDPGNRGEAEGWAEPDADLAEWGPYKVPSVWQCEGLNFNGVVWFRTTFEVPEAWQGRDLELSLGRIDDFDHTYVNGALVGSHPKGTPGACEMARLYVIPSGLLRRGANSLAIRVFDHVGQGGFLDPPQSLYVRPKGANERALLLSGTWLYRVEHPIPLVPVDVFAHCPAMPTVLRPEDRPSALYNGMIAPLTPLGLRGFVWYQGESNVEQHRTYAERFTAMIRDWRERFETPEAPFYFVQLASFGASLDWAFLREAQERALNEPHTARVVTLDIGDRRDIHPRNKREVGRRLALLALNRTFAIGGLCDSGPECDAVTLRGAEAVVSWRHAKGLTTADGAPPRAFEVAGVAGVFEPALAKIECDEVVLHAEGIERIVYVRYAFSDCPEVNLVNDAQLPAAPFRWPPDVPDPRDSAFG